MNRHLVVIGLSHKTAPVDIRERVAFRDEEIAQVCQRAAAAWATASDGEAMLLSTCNRVEFYLAASGAPPDVAAARAKLAQFLVEERQLGGTSVEPHLYGFTGDGAIRHLFRVASSLDSAVVGEPQILGQVKDAFERANQAGTVAGTLLQAVPKAFATAKRVRTETEIARSSSSVASTAVEVARRIFGDLRGKDVLVVGAGKMGALAIKHLLSAGCSRLLLVNRTLSRAVDLAARMNELDPTSKVIAEARPWEELPLLLARVDIVLSSTGAAQPVITRDVVKNAMKARKGRWLCLLDMAVPRDVAPDVGELDNVYLYDVDALTQMLGDNLAERQREAASAERIVDEEVARFLAGMQVLGVVPTIKSLREHFMAVAHAEVQRSIAKMKVTSEKEQRDMELLAESIVNKLLHPALTALKRESDPESLVQAVRTLFPLGDDAAGSTHATLTASTPHSAKQADGPVLRMAAGGEESGQ